MKLAASFAALAAIYVSAVDATTTSHSLRAPSLSARTFGANSVNFAIAHHPNGGSSVKLGTHSFAITEPEKLNVKSTFCSDEDRDKFVQGSCFECNAFGQINSSERYPGYEKVTKCLISLFNNYSKEKDWALTNGGFQLGQSGQALTQSATLDIRRAQYVPNGRGGFGRDDYNCDNGASVQITCNTCRAWDQPVTIPGEGQTSTGEAAPSSNMASNTGTTTGTTTGTGNGN